MRDCRVEPRCVVWAEATVTQKSLVERGEDLSPRSANARGSGSYFPQKARRFFLAFFEHFLKEAVYLRVVSIVLLGTILVCSSYGLLGVRSCWPPHRGGLHDF